MKSKPIVNLPHELLLVSQSPRRREILSKAGFLFRVDIVEISEFINKNVSLGPAVSELARTKALGYLDGHKYLKGQRILLLAADTIVSCEGQILGKPKNTEQAKKFLQFLSGKSHSVITGFAIIDLDSGRDFVGYDESLVQFRNLSASEIEDYIKSGEPMDKAGAYAIQGDGKKFVSELKGSWANVVGFPIEMFEKVLIEKGWHVARASS